MDIRRIDKDPNAQIRELCRVTQGVDDRIAKRIYVGVCGVSHSGRPQKKKRWTDNVKDCLKERSLDVREARRMVHDKSVQGEMCGALRGG